MSSKISILDKILKIVTLLFIFLCPLIFIPSFTDPYDLGRQIFLFVGSFVVLACFLAKSLSEKKLSFQKISYLGPVFLLAAVYLFSTLINAPSKPNAFLTVSGPINLFLLLIFMFIVSIPPRKLVLWTLLLSSSVLGLITLVLFLGNFNFPLAFPSLNLSLTKAWSPTGSLISQAVILLLAVPLGFALVYEETKEKKLTTATLAFAANVISLSGLGVALYLLTSEAKPILLPQTTAWAIAVESLKTVRFALLGMGPGQFANAFSSFKPLSFNNSQFWNLRFNVSSNWYFQVLTEVGLIGLLFYLNLVAKIIRKAVATIRESQISPLKLAIYFSLVISLIAQFFLPLNLSLLVVFFLLLGLAGTSEEKMTFDLAPLGNLVILLLAPVAAFWGFLFYFLGKTALANHYFLSSIKAANQNDGVKTYNLQIKAISTNPSAINYRVAYSQTNFALANSLAAKKDLSDQDRTTITQLVQQSLREAKAALAIDSRNVAAWENLSNIYRNLINFAEGADQWTVASYQEAIRLDPLNPKLRLDLGGLYYGQKNFNQAASIFLQATQLKADFANAHYNLANALRELGAFADAKREYEITQSLVSIDSNDYQKVTSELEEVKKRIPTPTPTPVGEKPGTPETLSTPQAPSGGLKPPLELPNEGPPVSPAPEEEATPTVQP